MKGRVILDSVKGYIIYGLNQLDMENTHASNTSLFQCQEIKEDKRIQQVKH